MNSTVFTAPQDRLIDFRCVNKLVGARCQTSHTARSLAKQGLIRAVRINQRVIRFSENSVFQFIAGGHSG